MDKSTKIRLNEEPKKLLKNETFKDELKHVIEEVLKVYNSDFSKEDFEKVRAEPDKYNLGLYRFDNDISQTILSNSKCVELMKSDELVKPHIGSLVGGPMYHRRFDTAEEYIIFLIQHYYIETKLRGKSIDLDKLCDEFVDFFYNDTLLIRKKCILHNFDFDGESIELAQGITIRKISEDEKKEYKIPTKDELYSCEYKRKKTDDVTISDFLIEAYILANKYISNKHTNEQTSQDLNIVLNDVITSIRILKPASTYCDNEVRTKIITFSPGIGGDWINTSLYTSYTPGGISKFSQSEANELALIYQNYKAILKDIRFKITSSRLYFGIERRNFMDKIIDYIIGLESAYLPGFNTELRFQLSLRCSFLLNGNDVGKAEDDYKFLKDMYKLRNDIVHGNEIGFEKLSFENCNRLENILRKTIKLWLLNPEKFLAKNLEKLYFSPK